jgi:hypothetical protein
VRSLHFAVVATFIGCSELVDGLPGPHIEIDLRKTCKVDADCKEEDSPRGDPFCDNQRCSSHPKTVSLRDDVTGDCHRPECVNGSEVSAVDDSDKPNALTECAPRDCRDGEIVAGFSTNGMSCRDGEGVCKDRECVSR